MMMWLRNEQGSRDSLEIVGETVAGMWKSELFRPTRHQTLGFNFFFGARHPRLAFPESSRPRSWARSRISPAATRRG